MLKSRQTSETFSWNFTMCSVNVVAAADYFSHRSPSTTTMLESKPNLQLCTVRRSWHCDTDFHISDIQQHLIKITLDEFLQKGQPFINKSKHVQFIPTKHFESHLLCLFWNEIIWSISELISQDVWIWPKHLQTAASAGWGCSHNRSRKWGRNIENWLLARLFSRSWPSWR